MSAFFRRNGIQLNGKIPIFAHLLRGEMPEWSIGPHSKCGVRATVPGVRIPLSPQRKKCESSVCKIHTFFFIQ